LTEALNHPETREEASLALRDLISEIQLAPVGAGLAIELPGELAATMPLGANKNARSKAAGVSLTLVAGGRFGLCLPFAAYGLHPVPPSGPDDRYDERTEDRDL
jgi:hypothetical protein